MSSFVLAHVAPDKLQHWIAVNAPGSISKTPGDSWRNYLAANSGAGKTMYDLESSFLTAAGFSSGTMYDRWNAYLAAQPGKDCHQKLYNKYR